MKEDRVLRCAEDIEAAIRRHGFTTGYFGELYEAFEIAVSRTLGEAVPSLARREEHRMIREIHRAIIGGTVMDR